jgi:hypothetical protein
MERDSEVGIRILEPSARSLREREEGSAEK